MTQERVPTVGLTELHAEAEGPIIIIINSARGGACSRLYFLKNFCDSHVIDCTHDHYIKRAHT